MIDGLRAIAVFLVIFGHMGLPSPSGLGVLIFFVISGFLITWLLLKEVEKTGNISLRAFYARRSLRIFPAFYAYAALLLVLLAITHKHIVWPQVFAALLYYNNYYQAILGDPNTGLSHTWSLAVEEQFYLLWPLMFLWWKHRLPRLRMVLIGIIGAFWVYRALLEFVLKVNQGYLYEAFDARADHLLVGCLLALVLWSGRFDKRWEAVTGLWQLALCVGGLVISVLLEMRYSSPYRDSMGFIVNPLFTAMLIVQLIACRDSLAVAWMQSRPVRYLGRISYSLYLYQQLVLPPAGKLLGRYPLAVEIAGSVAAVVLAASASYYVIEKPFLRLKKRFSPLAHSAV